MRRLKSYSPILFLLCICLIVFTFQTTFVYASSGITVQGYPTQSYFSIVNKEITLLAVKTEMQTMDKDDNITYIPVYETESYNNYKTTFIVRSTGLEEYNSVTFESDGLVYQNDLLKLSTQAEVDAINAVFDNSVAKIGDYVFSAKYVSIDAFGKTTATKTNVALIVIPSVFGLLIITYGVLFYLWKIKKVKGKFFDKIFVWLNKCLAYIRKKLTKK